MPAYRAISGASCKVYLAATGQEVGWATGVDVTETITNVRVDVIGDLDSAEITPVRRAVTMSVAAMRIQRTPLEALGVWSQGDTATILATPALDFAVIDDTTGEALLTLQGCKPSTRTFRVDASSLFSENLSFDVRRIIYQGA